jgi:hypothetical protein
VVKVNVDGVEDTIGCKPMRTIVRVTLALVVVLAIIGSSGVAVAHEQDDASDRESPCGALHHLEEDHDVGGGDDGVEHGHDQCHDGTGT